MTVQEEITAFAKRLREESKLETFAFATSYKLGEGMAGELVVGTGGSGPLDIGQMYGTLIKVVSQSAKTATEHYAENHGTVCAGLFSASFIGAATGEPLRTAEAVTKVR